MNRLFVLVAGLALVAASTYGLAADTANKEALTSAERTELRSRAEKLMADHPRGGPIQEKAVVAQRTALKKEELTREERAELRSRADRLTAERAARQGR